VPHVITQACCGDASCVFACPVNAIQPNPDSPEFTSAEMLYIDPRSCVDCGACVAACPVGAISHQDVLGNAQLPFVSINADYHRGRSYRSVQARVPTLVELKENGSSKLRVAVVGAGPAGLYAADELLKQEGIEVTVYDRLPTPYGLVRAGVAPDHLNTKAIVDFFRRIEETPGFHYALGVEIGRDVKHEELLNAYEAVIYATGASQDRRLEIGGEDLQGSATATQFVAWYNGHPDQVHHVYDLNCDRAVIVGNGNVALDVARILATDPERLSTTDIADHALTALRASKVNEIVVLGRRGPEHAAFTLPELTGLASRDDIDLVVSGLFLGNVENADFETARKLDLLQSLRQATEPRDGRRRIELRFLAGPQAFVGTHQLEAVRIVENERDPRDGSRVVPTERMTDLKAGLVLRSIGYRGVPVAGLPFDDELAIVPNSAGRVHNRPRTYAVGWIKRGPSGFIGTNKTCAQETVNALLGDYNIGLLHVNGQPRHDVRHGLRSKHTPVDLAGWRRLDSAERARGLAEGRPRVKITDPAEIAALAAGPGAPKRLFAKRSRR